MYVHVQCHVHVYCTCISLPLQTFPEIIPFIEVCVKMMEQVYNVPVDIDNPTIANDRGQPSQVQYCMKLIALQAYPFVCYNEHTHSFVPVLCDNSYG